MRWKKISSKQLFTHPRHSVYEDEVELPNGSKSTYLHFGNVNDGCMIIARNSDGLFLFQTEYSYPPDEALYQLPGGAVEKDEQPIEGARRELAEETGLAGDLELLGWFYANNRRSNQKVYLYEATNLTPASAEKDPEELFEDHWLTAEQVNDMIRANEIRNYTALAGWAIYTAKRGK